MTGRTPAVGFVALGAILATLGCKSAESGAFQCINDDDCPPGCSCDTDFVTVGVCDRGSNECGGTCDRESTCPEGTTCQFERTEGNVDFFACIGGDLGESCTSDAGCDPNASGLGAFCCLDPVACGPNTGVCVEDCSTFSSGGLVTEIEGEVCQDNTECAPGLFCCLVPDAAGNCDFELDQSCTCRGDPGL